MPEGAEIAGGFVGRAQELDRLGKALAEGGRAVLVTGPPGVGKSRLVARAMSRFEGPVARADLGAARDLEDALRRIGRALSIELGDDPSRGVERIGQVLASRAPARLWLDDADGVIEACGPAIERWATGDVRVVVTSRRTRLEVPHATVTVGPLAREEAVTLLVERARRVRRDFVVTDAQRTHVWDLVERVDALPLAIELLAPRLRLLSPARLLERLRGGRGPVDALRDALDRSFELLAPWERDALAQCTVFRDGFYVDAAESVIAPGEGAPDVLTVLEALVDSSLLRTEAAPELPDEVRVRFFGAVRERAAEELADPAPARARHAAFFVDAAERWDAGIESPDEAEHTARLVIELPNLEAAHEHSEGLARARLGLVLHMAYQRRGPFARTRELVEDARAAAEGDDRLVARAELARARTLRWANRIDESEAALEAALEAATRAGDVETEAGCARNRAANAYRRGDTAGFEAHLAHALDAAARSGRVSDEVNARNGLGYLHAERGDFERAREELERALELARGTRIPGLIALAHSSLSSTMLRAERFEAAERHATEAIARYATLGYLRQWAIEHLVRAEARLWADDLAGAHEDAVAALERARWLALDAPLARALALRGKVAFFEQDFGAARDGLEEAARRVGEDHPEAAGLWAYAGAARAMMQHIDAAEQAFAQAGDDELARALRGFARVAAAKAGLARGEAIDLGGIAPAGASSRVEVRRVIELLGAVARSIAPGRDVGGVRLEVADDAHWFRLEGDDDGVDLTRRRALRGVLRGLVDRRVGAPGEPMSVDDVLESGWPGERMSPESGARRVYVTINRLRKLGLGDLLLTTGDGYMLAPRVDVVTV
ncbi:MAG: AAA family ATPase [Myxococcales bacterium]|nr:AAA family ATPase [Myxococcales bacterium]